jgi:hypothetical protein
MYQVGHYRPAERQREKERARASDALDLRQGRVSQADLRARNGLFSSLEIVESSIVCEEVFA